MALNWQGSEVKRRVRRAQMVGIDTTMAAAILHAKSNHAPGAHGAQRFESQTGSLERSLRIVDKAEPTRDGARGVWGSTDTSYALRIELGFQGKDSAGRVVDAPAFPYLRPAAEAEYPLLARRIRRALA